MPKKKLTREETTQRITEVTSVISHQLKTPLAGIKSSLEVLLSGDLGDVTAKQREYLVLALDGANKMIGLVKNLLDASRIDEGRMQLAPEPTDIGALAKAVVDDLATFAQAKNTTLSITLEENLPKTSVDTLKIHEVINNIVYNAIRYSKGKGAVIVSVRRDGHDILFSCEDTGIGIAEGDKEKIFSKFYRSPDVSALAPDGSGLGLYISKAIVEKSGGKIWFESAEGRGSTFSFSLPIQ
ncbi:MAG: HAMP domain-containing sensor histidine kinase [Patescibacteria group bacterium]